MRKSLSLMAAATLAVGGFGWMSTHWLVADEQQQQHQQMQRTGGQTQLPAGIQKSDQPDIANIREVLGECTDQAFTKGGLDDLIERFTQSDRDRLNQFIEQDEARFEQLNGRIAQIQKAWKDKYNQDFDLNDEVVFGDQYQNLVIVQGEVVNPALLTNWPVTPTSEQMQPGQEGQQRDLKVQGQVGDMQVQGQANVGQGNIQGQGGVNIEKGKSVAIVTLPSSHNLPELNLSLIEGGMNTWKLDVPDTLTGQQLYDQLLNHLTVFGDMSNQWPADVNEAYRMAAHHVFMACYNISVPHTVQMQIQQPGAEQQDQQKTGEEGYQR